jgi:hypothetical protein
VSGVAEAAATKSHVIDFIAFKDFGTACPEAFIG